MIRGVGSPPPRITAGTRRVRAGAASVLALVAVACTHSADSAAHRRVVPATALAHVPLGTATPADVERLFGAPDERQSDGALVYRADVTKPHGSARSETITFRFERGVLSRVCRRETGRT